MSGIQIVGVMDEDPFAPKTWSGLSAYLFRELQRRNVLSGAVSAQLHPAREYLEKLVAFQPDMTSWRFAYGLSTHRFKKMTAAAWKQISRINADYNVVLQVGAWYDMSCETAFNVSYHDGNLAMRLASPYGSPKVRESIIRRALEFEKNVYAQMNLICPMSTWLADSFHNDFGVPRDRLVPVGAGINLPRLADTRDRTYDGLTILMVGKAFERKGGPTLLKAFEEVRKAIPGALLRIVGPDRISGLPEGATCVGYIDKNSDAGLKSLLHEYSSASVFALPSLYEPYGVAFGEAMAHRLPCIGTRNCAMPEIISDGVTGHLVTPGDSDELAARLIEMLRRPEQCKEMGEHGYQNYLDNFTWERVVDRLISAIRDREHAIPSTR